jgi:uncharacterized protein (TIGR03083 family)
MTDVSWLGPPIDVRSPFAPLRAALVELLRGLGRPDWARPTACPGWSVHDIAAHILGDHVGRLSRHRDGFRSPPPATARRFPPSSTASTHPA